MAGCVGVGVVVWGGGLENWRTYPFSCLQIHLSAAITSTCLPRLSNNGHASFKQDLSKEILKQLSCKTQTSLKQALLKSRPQ